VQDGAGVGAEVALEEDGVDGAEVGVHVEVAVSELNWRAKPPEVIKEAVFPTSLNADR